MSLPDRVLLWLTLSTLLLTACSRHATRGEVQFADGLEQLALGDTVRALELLEEARYQLGNDHRVLFHIGRLQADSDVIAERVRARENLQQAIDRSPGSAHYKETLGELLQRQRFHHASTSLLHDAVQQDPTLGRAWLLLGDNIRRKYFRYPDRAALLDSAMSCYASALIHGPEYDAAAFNLAFLHLHAGDLELARGVLLPRVVNKACPGRYGMLLTAIEYKAKQYTRAAEVAERTLLCMGWPEKRKWIGLQSILLPNRMAWWEDRSEAQRDSLAEWFWWGSDPTPTSMVNERLLEHLTRVVQAEAYFTVPRIQEGATSDRGEIWLRYGEPRMAFQLFGRERPAWRWIYGPERGRDRGASFDFVDPYLNDNYLRVRRGTGSDFSYAAVFDVVPHATRLQFRRPPGGMHYQMRYFRGTRGRTAVEIAFALQPNGDWRGVMMEAAGWRGPRDRAVYRKSFTPRTNMIELPDGRLLGRMRFEVPSEELVLGLQARPASAKQLGEPSAQARWLVTGRDTLDIEDLHGDTLAVSDIMLAYDIIEEAGGVFDMGGVVVHPRVDARIQGRDLKMYFEVYPSSGMLESPRPLSVRYAVRPRAPESFGFWDQFKPGTRRRWDPDRLPAVQSTYRFVPDARIEQQHIEIDVSVLERGPYELRVELEDPRTGATTSRVIPFLLLPEQDS